MLNTRLSMLSVAVACCILVGPTSADEAAQFTIVEQVPVVPSECRCGIDFIVSGTVNVVTHTTQTSSGVFSATSHRNYQGVTALALIPGGMAQYRAVGSSIEHVSGSGAVNEFTIVDSFLLIGQGGAPNLRAHAVIHSTIHADGTVTSDVSRICIDCPDGSSCEI